MLEDISTIALSAALALYFYCDYKRVKQGGGNLKEYLRGIFIFIVILIILRMIF